jgi:hypothetical protein
MKDTDIKAIDIILFVAIAVWWIVVLWQVTL